VTDRFNAKEFTVDVPFPEEGWHNLTLKPKNSLQDDYPPLFVTFEMVGRVTGLKLRDGNTVTA